MAGDASQDVDYDKTMYEESILLSILGPDYAKYISTETGQWENEREVLDNFYLKFQERIKIMFAVEHLSE